MADRSYSIPIDRVSSSVPMIGESHHQVHMGELFDSTKFVTGDTSDKKNLAVFVGSKEAHALFRFESNVQAHCKLYESPTLTASGTLETIYNRKRSSSRAPLTHVRRDASYSSAGTMLEAHTSGSTGFKEGSGGDSESRREWLLKPSTVYLWEVEFKADNGEASLGVEFYEED